MVMTMGRRVALRTGRTEAAGEAGKSLVASELLEQERSTSREAADRSTVRRALWCTEGDHTSTVTEASCQDKHPDVLSRKRVGHTDVVPQTATGSSC